MGSHVRNTLGKLVLIGAFIGHFAGELVVQQKPDSLSLLPPSCCCTVTLNLRFICRLECCCFCLHCDSFLGMRAKLPWHCFFTKTYFMGKNVDCGNNLPLRPQNLNTTILLWSAFWKWLQFQSCISLSSPSCISFCSAFLGFSHLGLQASGCYGGVSVTAGLFNSSLESLEVANPDDG